jgi:hypothetical protein
MITVALIVVFLAGTRVWAADNEAASDVPSHSKAFAVLASTYVALNALDIYTTTTAIRSGAGVEANPVVAPAAQNPVALSALKAATTATTIVLARQLWKKHPAAAIALLVGANVGMSYVVMHNAEVIRR